MNGDRFDDLLRAIAVPAPRRRVAALLAGGLMGALVTPSGRRDAAARACPPCRKKRQGTCRKKRPNGTPCGGGKVCRRGRCVCPAGTERCGESCVPVCSILQVRNPLTCGCCKPTNLIPGCSVDDDCCSGNCLTNISVTICIGRDAGEPCGFDAQCQSASCAGGACTAP